MGIAVAAKSFQCGLFDFEFDFDIGIAFSIFNFFPRFL
jgi:hypothetical protein